LLAVAQDGDAPQPALLGHGFLQVRGGGDPGAVDLQHHVALLEAEVLRRRAVGKRQHGDALGGAVETELLGERRRERAARRAGEPVASDSTGPPWAALSRRSSSASAGERLPTVAPRNGERELITTSLRGLSGADSSATSRRTS